MSLLAYSMLAAAASSGQIVHGPYGEWETGTWSVKRHLSGGTFALKWKIVPYRRKANARPFTFSDKKYGIEEGWPEVSFATIRGSYRGKRIVIPRSAYADCFDAHEFRIFYDNGAPIEYTWNVREFKDHLEVETQLGAHGGRIWVIWQFRGDKYIGRQFSIGGDGESAPRKNIRSIS